jgi:ATP-dependent Lhr-like helicase
VSGHDVPYAELLKPELFTSASLAQDALESVDVAEIAKVQFREIARVAGLVTENYPGFRRPGRQTQVSSSLIYDVFAEFDPENLLLMQARREVLERHFERSRLARTMDRLRHAAETGTLAVVQPDRPGPLAYPLVAERMSAMLSGETLQDKLATMRASWESACASPSPAPAASTPAREAGPFPGVVKATSLPERPRVKRKPGGLRNLS